MHQKIRRDRLTVNWRKRTALKRKETEEISWKYWVMKMGREDYFWTLPAPCSGFNLLGNIGMTACVCVCVCACVCTVCGPTGMIARVHSLRASMTACVHTVCECAWLHVYTACERAWLHVYTACGRAWLHVCTQSASGHDCMCLQPAGEHDCMCTHSPWAGWYCKLSRELVQGKGVCVEAPNRETKC